MYVCKCADVACTDLTRSVAVVVRVTSAQRLEIDIVTDSQYPFLSRKAIPSCERACAPIMQCYKAEGQHHMQQAADTHHQLDSGTLWQALYQGVQHIYATGNY